MKSTEEFRKSVFFPKMRFPGLNIQADGCSTHLFLLSRPSVRIIRFSSYHSLSISYKLRGTQELDIANLITSQPWPPKSRLLVFVSGSVFREKRQQEMSGANLRTLCQIQYGCRSSKEKFLAAKRGGLPFARVLSR